MQIGFIGLGQMGQAMARHLLTAGHSVTVWNRTPKSIEGANLAFTPGDAANAEIAITMLADDAALEAVAFGPDGLLAGLPPGALHVGMSTTSPVLARRLLEAHHERGQHFLAAPVFGRPDAATAAKLFIAVAGDAVQIARAQPVFDALGQRTFIVGDRPDQANIVKLAGNFLITCVIEGLSEVFAVASKAGVDRNVIFDLFTSTLFNAPVYKNYGRIILDEAYTPPGFPLVLGMKDNRLMLEAAAALATPMPFASVLRDQFLTALAAGQGEMDWSSVALSAQRNAGVPPKTR